MANPRQHLTAQIRQLTHELEQTKNSLNQAIAEKEQLTLAKNNETNAMQAQITKANEELGALKLENEHIKQNGNALLEEIQKLRAENLEFGKTIKSLQETIVLKDAEIEEHNVHARLLKNAANGNLNEVETALERGANVESIDSKTGATALFLSVANNHIEVAQYLTNIKKANLEVTDKHGNKLLNVAVTSPNTDIAKLIISNYPKRDRGKALTDAYYLTNDENLKHFILNHLLLQASKQGLLELAKFALENGADVNAHDHIESALRKACDYGHTEIVALLLKHNCKVDIDVSNPEIKELIAHYAQLKENLPNMIHSFFHRKNFDEHQLIDEAKSLIPKLLEQNEYQVVQALTNALQARKIDDIKAITANYNQQQQQNKM